MEGQQMKQMNSWRTKGLLMLLLTTSIVVIASPVSASNLNLNFSSLSFSPEADLVSASSNLGPGFSRRYENVATIDGVIVDAMVTIVSQSGNVNNELDTFDEYDNTQHLSAHTKPSGTAEASGKIKVEFVADGTSTPVVISNVRASIADIDAHEFGTFYGITSYRLSSDTQLSRSGTTAGVYRFHSSTTGASSTDEKRLVEVDYGSTSSVTSEFGCRQNASSSIGAGGKCGFTVVIGTFARVTSAVETAVNRPTYTISYNSNNGTSGTVPASTTGTSAITISGNSGLLEKAPDIFLGWNTLANGTGVSFPPGTSFVPSEDMVLFAQYGPPPTPPTADDETSSGAFDTNQVIESLIGDAAGVGATLIATSVKLCVVGTANTSCNLSTLFVAGEGTYTVDPVTGVVTFDPLSTFTGQATAIKYVVADSIGQLASATIAVTVDPSTPTADDETSSGAFDTNQVIDVLIGDAAGVGATLIATSVKLCVVGTANTSCNLSTLFVAGEGTYTVDPVTGVVTFDPLSTFTGQATAIKYVVADSTGQLATATITPTVSALASAPTEPSSSPSPSGPVETPSLALSPPSSSPTTTLPKTGLSPNMLLGQLGVWILVAGAIVWRLSTLRRRRPYQLPRWLNEIDSE